MQPEPVKLSEFAIKIRRVPSLDNQPPKTVAPRDPVRTGSTGCAALKMSQKEDVELTIDNTEKQVSPEPLQDKEGYILDARLVQNHGLKTDKTGKTVL